MLLLFSRVTHEARMKGTHIYDIAPTSFIRSTDLRPNEGENWAENRLVQIPKILGSKNNTSLSLIRRWKMGAGGIEVEIKVPGEFSFAIERSFDLFESFHSPASWLDLAHG